MPFFLLCNQLIARATMTSFYVGVVRNAQLEGGFDIVEGVDSSHNVRAFKERIRVSRARLRDVELGDLTIFGPWAAQPRVAEVARLVGEEPCHTAAILRDLVGNMERAYVLVRMTGPTVAPALDVDESSAMQNSVASCA